ncbi:Methyltransferase-like protein 23 [Apophysomyces sp. BC1034]|nr:Methyltransferase-like protein 23 [Apophysomyces sp. BC1021]KAG0187370.1 Methyltransferase-like protein 23 [Apophysomyces sp. BC1034]
MADYVWHERHRFANHTVLEVGAVLAKADVHSHVILSDVSTILPVIRSGLALNQLQESAKICVRELMWGEMETSRSVDRLVHDIEVQGRTIDYILGSDTFYDPVDFEKLLMVVSYIIHRHQPSCKFITAYQERSAKRSIQYLLDKWMLRCRLIPKESFDFDEYRFLNYDDEDNEGMQQDKDDVTPVRVDAGTLSSVFLLEISAKI